MDKIQIIYLIVILVYLAGMVVLGLLMGKKVKSTDNYYTSDRNMSAPVTGFSFSATQMSSGTVMGMPGTTYGLGYNYTPGNFASAAAPWFSFIMIGERMRKIGERIDANDYGDVFGVRYGKKAKLLYAVIILLFYIPLIVAQFQAAGNIMTALTGLPYIAGVILIGVVILIYTMTGGMFAVAWTDFVQGLIMMLGVGGLAAICLYNVGGFTQMNLQLAKINPQLVQTTGFVTATWAICNIISWSFLQIGGSAAAIVRFLIPKDLKTLKIAFGYSMFFQIFVFVSCAIIGLCGPILEPTLAKPDQIVPILIGKFLNPFIGGVLVSGIIAAMMSTVDSVLLLCSSAATRNIYLSFINPKATQEQQLKLGKLVTLIIGIVAILVAFKPFTAIQWMVAFSFNVFASAFTIPILYAVWWPRASKIGGLLGMISGAVSSLVWYAIGWSTYGSFANWPGGIWPGVIGLIVSFLVTTGVSLVTKPPEQDVVDIFYLE